MGEYTHKITTEADPPISNGVRLLILTQAVDLNDPTFSFFHRWIVELSRYAERVHVICLKQGTYNMPKNVFVHSLGKEKGRSRLKYIMRLYRYVQGLHGEYDAVFVHQNQEYILLAGFLWLAMRKKIYFWRNHYAGSVLTDIAVLFCARVFCTSRFSYTARYKKTSLMPVGIDTELFRETEGASRKARSILSIGRIAPSKRLEVLVDACGILKKNDVSFSLDIYGDALLSDGAYLALLKQKIQEYYCDDSVVFHSGVPNNDTVALYNVHEYFVNTAGSGMLDKTIFEAMACGTLLVTSNKNLRGEIDPALMVTANAQSVAGRLQELFLLPEQEKARMRKENHECAKRHDLSVLIPALMKHMS